MIPPCVGDGHRPQHDCIERFFAARYGSRYLLADLDYDYNAPLPTKSVVRRTALAPGEGSTNGGGSFEMSFSAQIFTTNDLWLEILRTTNTVTTNGTAWLVIHPPWNTSGNVYDLFFTTNLATPHGWSWIYRCAPGQTNLTVGNLTNALGFFILGKTNDTDADGLTDAYEKLVSGTLANNSDTDGDGWSDWLEVLLGTNPNGTDLPLPTFSVAASGITASESGTNGQFLITRSVKFTNAVSVYYAMSGTAQNGEDYNYLPEEILFAAGQSNALVTVVPIDDAEFEGGETVALTLLPDFHYDLGSPSSATLNLADNDQPVVSVTVADGVALEGSTNYAVFTLTRSGYNADSLAVDFALTGTATNGVDYTFISTNLTIGGGSNSLAVTVKPINNTNYSGPRTVLLTLKTNAAYAVDVLASNAMTTIVINDDELPTVQVVADDNDAREGSPVRAGIFRFVRSKTVSIPLVVNFSTHGTAAPGDDFDLLPDSVTIPAGTNSVTLAVHPVNDSTNEFRETVMAVLRGGGSYKIAATNTATVFIDDNQTPAYEWEVLRRTAMAVSGLGLPADIVVRRKGATTNNASFPIYFSTNASLAYPALMSAAYVSGDTTNNVQTGSPSVNNRFWLMFTNRATEAHVYLNRPTTGAVQTEPVVLDMFVTNLFGTDTSQSVSNVFQEVYFTDITHLFSIKFLTNAVTEGGSTTLRITRGAAPGSGGDYYLPLQLSGTATPAADYTFTNLLSPLTNSSTRTIYAVIPFYAQTVDLPFRALADSVTEGYETVTVSLDPLATDYAIDSRTNWMASLNIRDTNAVGTPPLLDSDGDGMDDTWENKYALGASTFNDPYADSDGDGVPDVEEAALGTSPKLRDSDGDGLDDYQEWTHGLNPLNAANSTLASASDYVSIKLAAASCYKCHQTTLNAGSYHLTSVPPIRGHTADATRREQAFQFLKGVSYPVSITGPAVSDSTNGAYTAAVLAEETPPGFFLDDPQGMLGTAVTVSNLASKTATLIVPKLLLGVDADRDGQIRFDGTDDTASQPYRFWVNDDHDVGNDNSAVDAEVLSPALADSASPAIDSVRDLEDFSQLQLQWQGMAQKFLTNGAFQARLYLTNLTGAAQIRCFPAVETNGGTGYLTNLATGTAQTAANSLGVLSASTPMALAAPLWQVKGSNSFALPLIFEGVNTGQCALTFVLVSSNGQTIAASAPLYLDLKPAAQLYEHWTVGDSTSIEWDQIPSHATRTADSAAFGIPLVEAEQDYILFVHGWRMRAWERRAFASTAYKRLWQLGYKGRFGFFSWPTDWADIYFGYPNALEPQNYMRSERRAWWSAIGLRGLLNNLNTRHPGKVRLMAHSMGNIVTSEALLQYAMNKTNALVHSYAAMQAASVAFGYDTVGPEDIQLVGTTPENFRNYPPTGTNYYKGMAKAVAVDTVATFKPRVFNFHNQDDYALSGWVTGQSTLKPNVGWGYFSSHYYRINRVGVGLSETLLEFPKDRFEIFARACMPQSRPLGAAVYGTYTVGGEIRAN